MRKMTLLLILLLTLFILPGCTPQLDLTGRWETSPEETLCATILWLNGDSTFVHIQEGRTTEGTWVLGGDALTLTTSSGSFTCTLDRSTGTLLTHDGLYLYRQPDPDIAGYWMTYTDDAPKRIRLHLMDSGLFILEIYDKDEPATSLDGWEVYRTGRWALSGSLLTLRGDDRSVLTYRLNSDASRIETDAGILLKNYMQP